MGQLIGIVSDFHSRINSMNIYYNNYLHNNNLLEEKDRLFCILAFLHVDYFVSNSFNDSSIQSKYFLKALSPAFTALVPKPCVTNEKCDKGF